MAKVLSAKQKDELRAAGKIPEACSGCHDSEEARLIAEAAAKPVAKKATGKATKSKRKEAS